MLFYYFISHMVQMEVGEFFFIDIGKSINFISHMVQMEVIYLFCLPLPKNSLYPTWFRWKPLG